MYQPDLFLYRSNPEKAMRDNLSAISRELDSLRNSVSTVEKERRSGGGSGNVPAVIYHASVQGRDVSDSHPLSAITGLVDSLSGIDSDISRLDSAISAALVTNHENLSGLLGGAANDHYHLTSAQHTQVIARRSYTQSVAATTWGPFANPYGAPCAVEIIDSTGNEFDAEVVHASDWSTVTIQLKNAMSGTVLLT